MITSTRTPKSPKQLALILLWTHTHLHRKFSILTTVDIATSPSFPSTNFQPNAPTQYFLSQKKEKKKEEKRNRPVDSPQSHCHAHDNLQERVLSNILFTPQTFLLLLTLSFLLLHIYSYIFHTQPKKPNSFSLRVSLKSSVTHIIFSLWITIVFI